MNAKSIGMFVLLFAAGGLLSLAGAHALGWTGKTVVIENQPAAVPVAVSNFPAASAAVPTDFVEAAEASVEAVVHVKITAERVQNYYNPFNDLFFGRPSTPQRQEVQGSGSGVILSEDGYIVTNNHVIKDAKEITVVTANNDEFDAVLVGTDPTTDIALLKIEAEGLQKITVANSEMFDWASGCSLSGIHSI